MKHKKIKQYVVGMLGCMVFAVSTCVLPVYAGSSTLIVNKNSFQEKLDTAQWNASDDRVGAQNGKLVFTEESKSTTSLISKTIAKKTDYHDYIVKTSVMMDLRGIPEKGTFSMGLGLGSIEATIGEAGNIEIQFTKDGGTRVAVVIYDEDDNKRVVASTSASFGANVSVDATISADSVLSVTLGGKILCKEKLEVDGEGRVGFMQSGGCAVSISDVNIEAYNYDRPENVDVYEDFEKESINVNVLTADMVYTTGKYVPYGMEIREVGGNRMMVFQNMSVSYLGSMYKYSNFEITFDVIDMKRVAETDAEGNITVPKNDNIAISFGDEATDYNGYGYTTSTDIVVFNNKSQIASNNFKHVASAADKGIDFYNADCDRDFTVRLSVIDGIVTASVKWIEDKNFTEVLKYKVSDQTPLGYVHIWTTGSTTNFAVDNLSIVNKDKDPNLVEVDFKSAVYKVPEDFEYEKIGFNYRDNVAEEITSHTFSPYYIIPVVALVCVLAVVTVSAVSKKKGRDKQDDKTQTL